TYLWSDNSANQALLVISDGSYAVTVTSADGCVSYDDAMVTLNTIDDPGLAPSEAVCDTAKYDVYLQGSTYLWSNGITTNNIDITTSGWYSVVVEDQNGCLSYDTINVTVNTSPVVSLGADINGCVGDTFIIDALNPGVNYSWSTGESTQFISVSTSGSYWVEVVDANGCTGEDTIQTVLNTLPVINIPSNIEVCKEATFDAENNGASYLWSDNSTNKILLINTAGNYWVQVTDTNICQSTQNFSVNVNPVPAVSLGSDVILCNGETQSYDVSAQNVSYLWSDGSTSADKTFGTSGSYWVQLTNQFTCSVSDTVSIVVDSPINLDLGDDVVLCNLSGLELDAEEAATYQWKFDNTVVGNTRYYRVNVAGEYAVTVTSTLGCTKSDTITIQETSPIFFADFLVATTIDIGEAVQFVQVSEPEPILAQSWRFGDGIRSTEQHPVQTYYIPGDYDVTLVASNTYCTDTVVKSITVLPLQTDPLVWNYEEEKELTLLNAKLYPNPTNGRFNLEVELNKESEFTLMVFDLNGHTISSDNLIAASSGSTFISETEHNYTNLSEGLYFVGIVVNKKLKVLKFIKLNEFY
ncbi:MAG: PKD domain-containing protein, partial [Bacteroidetes bacterium]|nr:PKD domain-containing protein [Bacteroidota bacterium]